MIKFELTAVSAKQCAVEYKLILSLITTDDPQNFH